MQFGYKKNRPVLLLAPDAVLTINQDTSIPVSLGNGNVGSKNLVDVVTRMTVNLNIEGGQGSASLDLAIPRHAQSSLYGDGKVNIDLLSEIHIYMKGRFLDTDGNPTYYQVFWGLVTSVEESYSDGFYSVHLSCQDLLKWWDLSRVITQDSVLNSVYTSSPYRALGQIYSYLTGPEIIYALTVAMFQDKAVLLSAALGTPSIQQETQLRQATAFTTALAYWKKRFSPGSGLQARFQITGLPNTERLKTIEAAMTASPSDSSQRDLFKALRDIRFLKDPSSGKFQDDLSTLALPLFAELGTSLDAFNLSTKSPLEVALEVKNRLNYEFFMDTGGIIRFKPPFYNLPSQNNQVYTITDKDLISYTISHNLDQIYTRIDLEGSFTADSSLSNKPSTFFIDPIRSQKYGIKDISKSFNFIRDSDTLNYFAIAELNHLNKKEYTGTITIAGRPELKLGLPIYLECENIYAYIVSISHDFDFGQSFSTTLGIECVRRKVSTGLTYRTINKSQPFISSVGIAQQLVTVLQDDQQNENYVAALQTPFKAFIAEKPVYRDLVPPNNQTTFVTHLTNLSQTPDKASLIIQAFQAWRSFLLSQSQTPQSDSANLQSTAFKRFDAITAANSNFTTDVVVNKPSSGVYFQNTDQQGYELVFGFDYGLSAKIAPAPTTTFSVTKDPTRTTTRIQRP